MQGVRMVSKRMFGEFKRYELQHMIGRDDNDVWFVCDAETPDEFGLPAVIRQCATEADALEGLAGMTHGIVDVPYRTEFDLCVRAGYGSGRVRMFIFRIGWVVVKTLTRWMMWLENKADELEGLA